ncbi:MAG: hypothetical protein ABWY19_00495 [Marmoricola sp.]
MHATARRRGGLGIVVASLLLLAGCGSSEPEPVQALPPEAPADLCATVPAATRAGLVGSSSTDLQGPPTAACSLRSPGGAEPEVAAVVTWLKSDDEEAATQVYESQCRSIDTTEFRVQKGFRPRGADQACAGSGTAGGTDSATMTARADREIVVVRLRSKPAGTVSAMARSQAMLEGVLATLHDDS